jgi:hypothetical protein
MLVVVAAVLAVPILGAPAAGAQPGPATFTVYGSVEQVAITHATPGAGVALEDAAGETVAHGTFDAQGSYLFRSVTPGTGYRVIEIDAGTRTESDPTTVMSTSYVPPKAFYQLQQLQTGFGYITMRDGTKLSATITLPGPVDQGPYPTVIEYSGYDPSNPNAPQPSTLLAQLLGYATVGVNIRGTGCSGGSYNYFEPLQSLDGYDVVEAVAAQPWVANHKVGMVGISYPGISQLFVGQTQPPDLEALAPLSVIADTYRSTLYPGGIFNNGFALSWAQDRQNSGKPYGEGWEHGIVDEGGPNGQQCAENQLLRLQNPDLIAQIDDHPYYSKTLGDPLSPITFVNKIDVPVFLGGAWQDEQVGPQSADMLGDFTSSPDKHFMFTNGTHVESLVAQLQRWTEFLDFYVGRRIPKVPAAFRLLAPAIYQQAAGVTGMTLPPDRFDAYTSYAAALKAYRAEPDVRVLFENGDGDPTHPGNPVPAFEADFSQWPPKQTKPTTWYFQPDQQLSTKPPTIAAGDGRASTSYVYDPTAKPATDFSGSSSDIWTANPTYDWKPLPLGKALAFDSPPLKKNVVMVGTGSVDLWLRSTAPDTDLEVTLTELRPDGQERYVQSGYLRASERALDTKMSTTLLPWHKNTKAAAQPLPAGKFSLARVEIFPFAQAFRAGDRLRITVEAPGGNRPFWTFDDLPANGVVTNDIAHSIGHASKVVLPVIPGIDVPTPLPPCPSLRGQPCRTAYGNATPTRVGTRATKHAVTVQWNAPSTVRPGDTIATYTVREQPGGAEVTTTGAPDRVTFPSLAAGPHAFTVEADYANGQTSGWSTPSHTVTVAGSHAVVVDASGWTREVAGSYGNGQTTPTEPPAVSPASVAPTTVAPAHHSAGLPFTGGDVLGLAFIGAGLVLMGGSIAGTSRRRARAGDLPAP